MKQKLKNYLKFGILLFGVSLFTVACQKDDDLNKMSKLQKKFTLHSKSLKSEKQNLKTTKR